MSRSQCDAACMVVHDNALCGPMYIHGGQGPQKRKPLIQLLFNPDFKKQVDEAVTVFRKI